MQRRSIVNLIFVSGVSLGVAGCALPNAGPRSAAFEASAYDQVGTKETDREHKKVDYVLVDVNTDIIKEARQHGNGEFVGRFTDRSGPAADIRIGIGDKVSVTIFEAGSGGLFVPKNVTLSQGNFVKVPNQEVDRLGMIKVPYAGNIEAIGRRPEDIQEEIETRLAKRAIEPQAVVSIVSRDSNNVTVLGDVEKAGRFNISLKGYRILDAVGAAGGNKFQDFETLITLQRAQKKASVRMSALTRTPANNIYVQPGDTIFVQRNQRFFSLFGAATKNGEFAFDRSRMMAADALAKGGGLLDERADPYTVVIYRLESRHVLEHYGAQIPEQYKNRVPTVYRINVRDADGFFHSKHFELRNRDLVYVANSPWIDKLKINAIIRDYAGTIVSGREAVEAFTTKLPR